MLTYGSIKMSNYVCVSINPLIPGGDKKITHTETNLQLKAADLFKYVRTFLPPDIKGLKMRNWNDANSSPVIGRHCW